MGKYDLVVIGAGPGGYVAAIRAAQLGAKVLVVERDEVGGVCLNRGCIPTKTLIKCVELLRQVKVADRWGLQVRDFKLDYGKVRSRCDEVVGKLRSGIHSLFKARGIELAKGTGKLIKGGLEVALEGGGVERFEAGKTIVATGSRPLELPKLRFDGTCVISSDEVFELDSPPKSLLIVGGGVVGCEFAGIFNELGSEVTVVEMMGQLLPAEDPEVARFLQTSFKRRGIKTLVETKVEGGGTGSRGVEVRLSNNETLVAEKVLISVGRKANTEAIGLEEVGVKIEDGFIQVDDHLKTTAPDIYAIGDVIGGYLLAHVASAEGMVAAENAMGKDKAMDYKVVPNCIFTHPQIASCGLTEAKAKDAGFNVRVGKFPFQGLGKAHAMDEVDGFIKLVGDQKSEKLLGAQIIGPQATELIAEVVVAIKCGAKVSHVAEAIHAHPTLAEGIKEAAGSFYGEAIHWL